MDSSTKFGVGPEESGSLCSLNPDSSESSNRKHKKKKYAPFPPSHFFFQELVSDLPHTRRQIFIGGGVLGDRAEGEQGGCFLYLMEKREINEKEIKKKQKQARVASCCPATLLVCGYVR